MVSHIGRKKMRTSIVPNKKDYLPQS